MEVFKTVEHRGFNINIHIDRDAESPRDMFDGLGKMVCFHPNYILGDKHEYRNPAEAVFYILWEELDAWTETMDIDYQELYHTEFIEKYWPKFQKLAIVLPLYLYDHSGITMSTSPFSCPWDSGQVGFIYLLKSNARKECGRLTKNNLAKVISYIEGEVREYDYFLTGQVYGYTVEPTEKNKSIECDDSCWGYYGETDYMVSEAKSNIDCAIKKYKKEAVAAVKYERTRIIELNHLFSNCWAY